MFTKPKLNVLLIGLDHAGKTTLLEGIKSQLGNIPGIPPEKIHPTIGMNLAKIFVLGCQIVIWDLGGQIKMRTLWERYYEEAHAIIFVVDSSDIGRLEEAKLAYESVCDHENVSDIPVVLFANKQDLGGALSPGDLSINFYDEDDALRERVFPISALTGAGIVQAVTAVAEIAKANAQYAEN